MNVTIDVDDNLYRRLKIEAARRGRTVRELVAVSGTDSLRVP
jgi:plasmid stability protein